MSMTRDEAILLSAYTGFLLVPDFSEVHNFCEDALGRPIFTHEFADRDMQKEIQEKLRPQIMELIQNTTALRGPTREMVERMFPGCDNCRPHCGTCEISYAWDRYGKPNQCADCKDNGYKNYISESRFCEYCGKPLTDEAVDILWQRWKEALGDEN